MKIIALAILFLLLLHRIKNTPRELNKKLWLKNIRKSKSELKEKEEQITDLVKSLAFFLTLLFELFLIIFYAVLGCSIGTTLFIILSALQILTCVIAMRTLIKEFNSVFELEAEINDKQFHRWIFLFNIVLDYIYYPLGIYMLLK